MSKNGRKGLISVQWHTQSTVYVVLVLYFMFKRFYRRNARVIYFFSPFIHIIISLTAALRLIKLIATLQKQETYPIIQQGKNFPPLPKHATGKSVTIEMSMLRGYD